MRWIDILSQSLQNLLRRKLRSFLTMLGVVIGTAAIVVTLSLGAGAEKAQMEALESTDVFNSKLFSAFVAENGLMLGTVVHKHTLDILFERHNCYVAYEDSHLQHALDKTSEARKIGRNKIVDTLECQRRQIHKEYKRQNNTQN